MLLPIEIKFVDDARGDTLVVLTEKEQDAVRARCEDVKHSIRVRCLQRPNMIGHLFSEGGSVLTAGDALLAWSGWHRE